jgi:hypothetical protein
MYLYFIKEYLIEKHNDFVIYMLKKVNKSKNRVLAEKLKNLSELYKP